MIRRLAIFGATGDLTARYLLPALAALYAAGHLGDGFLLAGAGREEWDNTEFKQWAAAQLSRHAGHLPDKARQAVVSASRYHQANVTDPASVAAVIAGDEPVAAYLALPPAVFPAAVSALHDAGLPPGSRIVLEKPFGENLHDAVELNRLLAETLPEQAVFRVDHFLAMTTVQNVLGTRLANRVLEPIWNAAHIAEVELELDNWRWAGTVFRLRTGKALRRDRKELAVHFRHVPHMPFGHTGEALPNVLRFGLEPETLTLDLTGIGASARNLVPLALTARLDPPELPAYGQLLLDALDGNAALSIRGDEAEQSWRVLTPVLSAWSKDLVPLEEYPAGSDGPGPGQPGVCLGSRHARRL